MALEIERKFLVTGDEWRSTPGIRMKQGYLNHDSMRTVRIRLAGMEAFLTIKGMSAGATRQEFEYPVPIADAQALLKLCARPIVRKRRHRLVFEGFAWEVDAFEGDNAGLVIAEIELQSEDQVFGKPPWVGAEVTQDSRYFNSSLSMRPFRTWPENTSVN